MYRHAPLVILASTQAVLAGGAALFRARLFADLVARELPPLARERLTTAEWLVPSAVVVGSLMVVGGLVTKRGRSRLRLVSLGVVTSALPVVAVTLAFFAAVLAG
ncbi:MAG: hypothetical protein FJ095_03920 [Deltaproteobacteria bacterium]|nr:hypothetical protein [Deltaproteobacteria bacterium]